MKYILLDTNLYLDLVSNRSVSINKKCKDILLKLLQHDNCKLVIPEVVIHEFVRNVDSILSIAKDNLGSTRELLKSCYWVEYSSYPINTYEQEIDGIKKYLKKLKVLLVNEFDDIENKMKQWFRVNIFKNANSITVRTNDLLTKKVMMRRMHKLPPFHKKQTEFGDGLILETILNIKELIPEFDKRDKLYFITRNYSDFCDSDNKEKLHNRIIDSISLAGLNDNIVYSPYFYKTVKDVFGIEIAEVEKLEEEMARREEEYLSDLAAYEDYVTDKLFDYPHNEYIINNMINKEKFGKMQKSHHS
ncbi:DUF4935 domain-containing protein [Clostridium sp. 'deep sea']|uniref:PIN domain-containing protein n=1 Tax=Clostridium sp. 'deep sea' TaxID=2779445 RepID=UPI0018968A33|nr:PIN domain-containing protein [Clostridium sp. 'deep sea']QOR34452.1 DUF4935 domain-containing protein [Clostridium sp. 'deep sea']